MGVVYVGMVRGAERATWQEVCTGYAVSRSLLTGCRGGVPDTHTAARQLIKDYVDGKLRFCHLPPGQGALCPGVNTALMSAASKAAAALETAGAPAAAAGGGGPPMPGVPMGAGIEMSDAAVGAGDKDVRLALQGAREKIVFQMDSAAGSEAGVAVGQTNAARKGRGNRALSAGVWADADEASLIKVSALPLQALCVASRARGARRRSLHRPPHSPPRPPHSPLHRLPHRPPHRPPLRSHHRRRAATPPLPAGLMRSRPTFHTPPPTSPRPHTPAPSTHATTIAHVALPDPHPAPQALHSSARGVLAPPPQPLTAATGRHSPSSAGRGLRRRAARGGQAACWRAALLVVILVPRRSPFGHFSGVRPRCAKGGRAAARWRR